ncbi:GPI mannosyltransferase 1 [Ptychographa xylographoides]|nr:GPI mannosyltransferase 1 [Ptychographa xylographoides]
MSSYWSPAIVFGAAVLLRLVLLLYGLFQDAYSPLKYTDIDYFVFTDAARYVSRGRSPYDRETYRYTPLLAWMLLPTTWPNSGWFSFGKVVFAVADIITGWLIVVILRSRVGGSMSMERSLRFASIWLLNPMVATISTRGSSEGLLGVMIVSLVWAVLNRRIELAGVLLGLAVHFKIYPFIYAPSLLLYLASPVSSSPTDFGNMVRKHVSSLISSANITLTLFSFLTFMVLNIVMYVIYGHPFLQHTYLHHVTRIDHRHNFSPYNTLLYLSSSSADPSGSFHFESLAFLPQLLLSAVLIPLVLAKRDLPGTMLAQTFAFVALNKVCTSQYFIWFLLLVPLYLPHSSLVSKLGLGITAAALWVGTQALWLWQGYELEFLGRSTFVPGLWGSALLFYAVNMWILGIVVSDVGKMNGEEVVVESTIVSKN